MVKIANRWRNLATIATNENVDYSFPHPSPPKNTTPKARSPNGTTLKATRAAEGRATEAYAAPVNEAFDAKGHAKL